MRTIPQSEMGESAVVREEGKKVNGGVDAKRGVELSDRLVPVQLISQV